MPRAMAKFEQELSQHAFFMNTVLAKLVFRLKQHADNAEN
jgi:hypothetical protein